MTVRSITPLPPAPLRSQSPATFTTTAETFVDALEEFVTETNNAIDDINALSFLTNTWKGAVRVATTAAITLTTGLENGDTIDGVTLATGDRVLVKNQATQSENGVYVVAASGAPTRAADMNANDEVLGAVVFVIAGTANGGKIFYSTNTSAVTIGSSNLTFAELQTGGGALTQATTVAQSGTPATTSVGYLGSPQIADQDDYTLQLNDAGGHYYHVSATPHALTIPANASVAFPIGTVIGIVNESGAGNITLAITSDTLRWTDQTGSRTIAANGTATLIKVTSTVWRLTGDGIT